MSFLQGSQLRTYKSKREITFLHLQQSSRQKSQSLRLLNLLVIFCNNCFARSSNRLEEQVESMSRKWYGAHTRGDQKVAPEGASVSSQAWGLLRARPSEAAGAPVRGPPLYRLLALYRSASPRLPDLVLKPSLQLLRGSYLLRF